MKIGLIADDRRSRHKRWSNRTLVHVLREIVGPEKLLFFPIICDHLVVQVFGPTICVGTTSRSNSWAVTKPNRSAASFNVMSFSSAWCAILEALS